MAGIQAYFDAFSNPDDVEAILPLGAIGLTLMVLKTILGDLPFNLSNASYEAAEQIKEDITDSKKGPLVSLLMKPFANKYGLAWITGFSTAIHTLWDFTGLLLCVPPQVFIKLYKEPAAFWTVMVLGTLLSIPLFAVNLIQTQYFEGKESEENLKGIMSEEQGQLLGEKKSFLFKLLDRFPRLKTPLRYGFYSQAPLHAFADAMPAILLLRYLMVDQASGLQAGVIVPIAFLVFLFSTAGTQCSEVKTSIRNYNKEFRFIGKSAPASEETSSVMNGGVTLRKFDMVDY